jgi:hypothetical protein
LILAQTCPKELGSHFYPYSRKKSWTNTYQTFICFIRKLKWQGPSIIKSRETVGKYRNPQTKYV